MSKKKILTTMSPYKLSDGGKTITISGVDIDSSISIAREKARNISTLVISNSTIVGKDLLKFFKHVKKLKSLFIERNSIHNDTDAINLAELVVANKSLELLTLSNNDIGSSPLKTLLKNMKGSSIEDIIIEHTEDQFTKSEIEQIEQVITEVLPGVEIKITLAEDKENQRPFINQLNEVAESKMQEQARLNKEEAAAKALAEAARIEAERVEAERVKAEQEAAAKAKAALSLLEEEAAAAQAALQAQMQNEKAARLKAEEEARIKAEQEAQAALSLLEEEEAPAAQSEIQDNAEFEEEVQPEQVIFTQHPSDLDYYTFPDVSAVGQPAEAESTGCCCVIS